MSMTPTKNGLYWATLDDGNGTIETTVILVTAYSGEEQTFENGAVCFFADQREGDLQFSVKGFEPQIVRPWCTVYLGIRSGSYRDEVLVTWHGPVKPPASALKQKAVQA